MPLNDAIQDPTEIGTGGLKGLRGIGRTGEDVYKEMVDEGDQAAATILSGGFRQRMNQELLSDPIEKAVGYVGVGDSRYDKEIENIEQLQDLNNTRGELQSGFVQIASGLAKAGVLAGTTFLDGTLGTIVGIGTAAAEGRWSGLWDNPFSNAMNSINEWSEEALPNYYTNEELNSPWYTNIFTANFIGDKIIKNLGFAVGAAYSGRVGAGVLSKVAGLNKVRNAFKGAANVSGEGFKSINDVVRAVNAGEDVFMDGVRITEALAQNAKTMKYATPALKLTGAISGALGEARIEAIQNSKDWEETQINNLNQAYDKIKQEEAGKLMAERPDLFTYQNDGQGGLVPVPTAQGQAIIEGRAGSRFDYNGGLAKIQEDKLKMGNVDFLLNIPLLTLSDLWQFGKFYAGGYSSARKTARVMKDMVNGKAVYTPDKAGAVEMAGRVLQKGIAEGPFEEMGQSAIARGAGYKYGSELNSFYGAKIDPESEEESVGLLKAMGDAVLETYGNIDNYEEGFIGAISGMLGIPSVRTNEKGSLRPSLEGGAWEDIREIRAENARNKEVADALNKRIQSPEFLNYYQGMIRHNKFQKDMDKAVEEGDPFSFKNAEHSQLISDIMLFDDAGRIQDFYDILDEAGTIRDEDMESLRSLTTDPSTGKSVYDGMTDSEVKESIQKEVEDTRKKVDTYRKISSDLMSKAGTEISSDGLKELTWMLTQIDDWEGRFRDLHKGISEEIHKWSYAVQDPKVSEKLAELAGKNPMDLIMSLAGNKESSEYSDALEHLISLTPEGSSLLGDINDMIRISMARTDMVRKYNDYISNPEKLTRKIEEEDKTAMKEKEEKDMASAKEAAENASTPEELDEALKNAKTPEIRTKVESDLLDSGNELMKKKKEREDYIQDVLTQLDELSPDEKVRENAFKLFNGRAGDNAEIEELSNPENEAFKNREIVPDENEFNEASYILSEAIKNANKARERRKGLTPSKTEVSPEQEVEGVEEGGQEEMDNPEEMESFPVPLGTNSGESMKEANRNAESQGLPKGAYYAPAISEFSIDGQRVGDFTPFGDTPAGKKYKPLYDFLRQKGAFDAVNRGDISVGDRIHFLISEEFNEIVAENPDFNNTTIFMIKLNEDGSYQIVGSLLNRSMAERVEGLAELQDRLIAEYKKGKGDYISAESVAVSKVMVGRVPFGNEEKTLRSIPGVDENTAILGYMSNGVLQAPRHSELKIIQPRGGENGNLYLLLPDGAGNYRPVNIRTKYFSRSELGAENLSTPVWSKILSGIRGLATAKTDENLFEVKKLLEKVLYVDNVSFYMDVRGADRVLKITKVKMDKAGRPVMKNVDGKEVRDTIVKEVVLGPMPTLMTLGLKGGETAVSENTERPVDQVVDDIVTALEELDIPVQVSYSELNKGSYNKGLISSGVLTSNITEARFRGNWFTTDYFSPDGKEKASIVPVAPVQKASDSAVPGIKVRGDIYVEGTVARDKNGRIIVNPDPVVFAEAFYLKSYGENGPESITLPNGDTYNHITGKITKGNKETTKGPVKEDNTGKVVAQIAEDQSKVDRSRTDSDNYYILEEDGKYHAYKRVHSLLGSNWIEDPEVSNTLKTITASLSERSTNPSSYNSYLDFLKGKYGIDLTSYKGLTDPESRDVVVALIRDKLNNTKSLRATNTGKAIDSVVKSFFAGRETVKPDSFSDEAFASLMSSLTEIKSSMEARGERFITDNLVLYYKYPDGSRVAGEADILSVDEKGNFRIYDIKTGRYSFHDFVSKGGRVVNYYKNKSSFQNISTEQYYSKQLSYYKDLFESRYKVPVTSLGILPFVIEYDGDSVTKVTKEKGIPVKYNPTIPAPVSDVKSTADPVFNSSLETRMPKDLATEENRLEGSEIGYYVDKEGNMTRNYLKPIGTVSGIKIYLAKEARMSRGLNKKGPLKEIGAFYRVVLGNNGAIMTIGSQDPSSPVTTVTPEQAMSLVKGNPEMVKKLSERKTVISDFNPEPKNSSKESNKELLSIKLPGKRRPKTRLADRKAKPFNREEEISWLGKVLPQLSSEERLRVQEGLINVAGKGAQAWGTYQDGVITLSNIAAEGTLYHEAFHAVFDLMASEQEKTGLLKEARKKWGDRSAVELEELMAEEFREYTMGLNKKGLGRKILDFFKKLLDTVTNWKKIQPYTLSFYQKINEGRFSSYDIKPLSGTPSVNTFESLNNQVRGMLEMKGWTKESWEKISERQKEHAIKCASI